MDSHKDTNIENVDSRMSMEMENLDSHKDINTKLYNRTRFKEFDLLSIISNHKGPVEKGEKQ